VGIIGVIYLSGLAVNTLATLSAGLIADKLVRGASLIFH